MKQAHTQLLALVIAGGLAALPATAAAQSNRRGGERSGSGGSSSGPSSNSSGPRATPRDRGDAPRSGGADSGSEPSGGSNRSGGARPNDGNRVVGNAVARTGARPGDGGARTIVVPNYYRYGYNPWGYGGFGFGLGYGGWGYDPWGWGYNDPFYGSARGYAAMPWGRAGIDGALKIKVSPSDATVYVDGYYAGRVDDYDGPFQQLHLEPGPHQIEIRLDGYEPLTFDVRILPDRTITYKGTFTK